jgi:hypothetical protein
VGCTVLTMGVAGVDQTFTVTVAGKLVHPFNDWVNE